MRVLLITPPMTQLNTPYPATAYLTGFLRKFPETSHHTVEQVDLALELALKIFSRAGLTKVFSQLDQLAKPRKGPSPRVRHFLEHRERYLDTIDAAVRFLQGRDATLALRIVGREFLPEGPAFDVIEQMALPTADAALEPADLDDGEEEIEELDTDVNTDALGWAFGALGAQDRGKFLASLLITDIAALIKETVDPRFELARFGEKLAASQPTFGPLNDALAASPTCIDMLLFECVDDALKRFTPDVLAITAPFPGNIYGAFRVAQRARALRPEVKIALGGGYANTELRSLNEPRVFDFVDFITLDDGERPLANLLLHLEQKRPDSQLLRTFVLENGRVVYKNGATEHDIPHKDTGAPNYEGLDLSRYLTIFEMLNPMHRVWSDGRWNKLTLAHGCYWKKCTFCDVGLDYIGRYETAAADILVDRIVEVMTQTGSSGFHFVDEAAPPAVLRALSERLIARKVVITWWGNIRFEKSFTPELASLMARAGCVAISGGLEVAADRLLKLMQKGVTVEQTARVTHALTSAGVMVHAYLMYGFPTQTLQETIDSLERVRQLFALGCLQSAYWHQFAATVHSPIGINPKAFKIKIVPTEPHTFSKNDLSFTDAVGCDHALLAPGLNKALYNYMHGVGLDEDVRQWFGNVRVPAPKVARDLVLAALEQDELDDLDQSAGKTS